MEIWSERKLIDSLNDIVERAKLPTSCCKWFYPENHEVPGDNREIIISVKEVDNGWEYLTVGAGFFGTDDCFHWVGNPDEEITDCYAWTEMPVAAPQFKS